MSVRHGYYLDVFLQNCRNTVFLDGFMKIKALLFVLVALAMMTAPVLSVFANDTCPTEFDYVVTVRYINGSNHTQTTTVNVTAGNAREAERIASDIVRSEFQYAFQRIVSANARLAR